MKGGLKMVTSEGMQKSVLYGIVSGIVLTIFMKMIEQLTLYKVYTLLLNVDYIPILNRYQFSEIIEVGFHIAISIVLSLSLYLLIIYLKMVSRTKMFFCVRLSAYSLVPHYFQRLLYPTEHHLSQVYLPYSIG